MIWLLVVGAIIILFGFVVFFGAPYVPSQRRFVKRAFEQLYPVTGSDVVVDVGSGDGIVLRVAAEKGARAVGFEIHPLFVFISRFLSRGNKRVSVILANFWTTPLPDDATLVYAFSVSRDNKKLSAKLQYEANRLERPLRLMCHGSPLSMIESEKIFEAYYLYSFYPLQPQKAQV